MAPWLMPGDLVKIEPVPDHIQIKTGVVVVVETEQMQKICHRVIQIHPLMIKGDRVPKADCFKNEPKLLGVVKYRIREGKCKRVSHSYLLALASRWGLYPGQRIPVYFSRSRLKKLFNR